MFLGLLFKIISLLSLLAGSILVGVTFFTVTENGLSRNNGTNSIPAALENSTVEVVSVKGKKKVKRSVIQAFGLPDELDGANITQIIDDAKRILDNMEPNLTAAASVSLAMAVIQILVATVLILSRFKVKQIKSRHFSKLWNAHYFILGTILLICVIIFWSMDSSSSLLDEFDRIITFLTDISKSGITSDYLANRRIFYISIIFDTALLYSFGFLTLFCLTRCA